MRNNDYLWVIEFKIMYFVKCARDWYLIKELKSFYLKNYELEYRFWNVTDINIRL